MWIDIAYWTQSLSELSACSGSARPSPPAPVGRTLEDVLGELDVQDAEWRIGDYQILEEIGSGGIGVVYRARHRRRIVALKRILSYHADSRETLVRFRREAEAAASLVHPNILPIYEVSECDDGLPFFNMKFAGGGSLLDAAPALRSEPRRVVALMAKVARAVQYAHGQGILHRDLKTREHFAEWAGRTVGERFRSGQMPGTHERSDAHAHCRWRT